MTRLSVPGRWNAVFAFAFRGDDFKIQISQRIYDAN